MTVGWIFEGDRDRFLAARYPAPTSARAVPSFQCPFCKAQLRNRTEFSSHVQTLHTVKRPLLLLAGLEPGSEETVRNVLIPGSVEFFNCTQIAVGFDGNAPRQVKPTILAHQLAGLRRANVQLRLSNDVSDLLQPVVQEYHLKVLAPDEQSLATVDKLFLAELGVHDVSLPKLGAFYEATRNDISAEYAEALADYVRGILIKDADPRTGVSGRFAQYHEIHHRALNVLHSFDRPLARFLSNLIRFTLNDFSRWREPTGFAALDRAYAALGPPAQDLPSRKVTAFAGGRRKARLFVCPVDRGTDTVVRLAEEAIELAAWTKAVDQQFSRVVNGSAIDSFDRAKVYALWAAAALRLGANTSAERALRSLDGDPTFGTWANNKLAKVEP